MASGYAARLTRHLAYRHHLNCSCICQGAKCRGRTAESRFPFNAVASPDDRAIYRHSLHQYVDSAFARYLLFAARRTASQKMYGQLQIRDIIKIDVLEVF